ncbi:MAG TPA: hypothetical protein VF587_13400 [Solirubrobacteraceae bacterium]
MAIPRVVSARLEERFIFNFRLPPDELDRRLPAGWLKPQVINGWAVASFCVLKLGRMTLWPFPPLINIRTTSCAYRCGAIDAYDGKDEPTVYITDRNTDRGIIAATAPFIFSDTIPAVHAAIARSPGVIEISVSHLDGQRLFSADIDTSGPAEWQSEVFATLEDFVSFIKGGVSSWTPSTKAERLARVDLAKEDASYAGLRGNVDFNSLESLWRDSGMELDSVVRATGGRYRWTYRGLRAAKDQLDYLHGAAPVPAPG